MGELIMDINTLCSLGFLGFGLIVAVTIIILDK